MKVVIIGCGRVGARLARQLSERGDEVTLLDRDPAAFALAAARGILDSEFRGNLVIGDGCDADTLRRSGADRADTFIAVTEGDNRNIMAAQIAQYLFKVPRVICRIYDPVREEAYRKFGLNTFCPTLAGANLVLQMMEETR
ncbi:MAG: potassium channel family protein [Candidatus Dormibacteraceae bacterium]